MGADGVKRYVKFHDDPVQCYCELLTNRIYADLEIDSLECQLFEHEGKIAFASVWRDDLTGNFNQEQLMAKHAQKFLEGFWADVLTMNWDVLDATLKSVGVSSSDDIVRLDSSSGLLMDASGLRKPEVLLNDIIEIEAFFEKELNSPYLKVMEAAGHKSYRDIPNIRSALKHNIIYLRDEWDGWKNLVQAHAPKFSGQHPKEFQNVVDMLEARTAAFEALIDNL